MWRIRRFIENVWNLIVWFPVIWKDKPRDWEYYEDILLHKIKLQRKYFEKRQFFVGWESEVKWMKKCEYLLGMLVNNEYWKDEWDGKIPSDNGLSPEDIEYKQSKINYTFDWEGDFAFLNLQRTSASKCYANIWEIKTRRLFWKIFIWRYERWWD